MIPQLLLIGFSTLNPSNELNWAGLPPGAPPLENPLKGYAAYLDAAAKLSSYASMAYVESPWSELEPSAGNYRFDRLDARFDHPLGKGKPVVLRIWLDYPTRPSGVPKWLIDKGLKMTPYTEFGGGVSPDYANKELQRAMVKFIEALGGRYGDGKRVKFVQLGFLGHWGEWHTYPHEELFADAATQKLVIDALHRAFPHTHLLGRNPGYATLKLPWMGFHDDLIPDDTDAGEAWNFLPAMKANGLENNWKVAPTGGEMTPFEAKRLLSKDWDKLTSAVRKCHFSFISGYCPALEQSADPLFLQRSADLIALLGYTFRFSRISLPATTHVGVKAYFRIEGENIGVAPFYYPWQVVLALLRADGSVADRTTLLDDIRKWIPGGFALSGSTKWKAAPGDYSLAIGVIDPAKSRPAILFANNLPHPNGWTILSKLRLLR